MTRGTFPKRLRLPGFLGERGFSHGGLAAMASGGQPEPPPPPPPDEPDAPPIGEPPGPIPVPPAPEAPPMQLRASTRAPVQAEGSELPWMLRPKRPGFRTRFVASR